MSKTFLGGTLQQVVMGLFAALIFIMAVEASQLGFGGGFQGFGFFGWDDHGGLGWHSATIVDHDGVTKVRLHEDGCKIQLEKEGDVTFSDDETDIASLAAGSRLDLEMRGCGDKFELEARPGVGKPELKVKLDGKDAAWDATSRARFHDALIYVFSTGFDAEGRVERLWQSGGAKAVLDAADNLRSDSAQRLYLSTLLAKEELSAADTVRLWQVAKKQLSSDYELAEMILQAPDRYSADPQVRQAFLAALHSLSSDYELQRSLDFVLTRESTDEPMIEELVQVAGDEISSDYELAQFLIQVAEKLPAGASLPPSLERALESLSSDYEMQRTLEAFVERQALPRADLQRLLEVARHGISSDYELASFLISVAKKQKSSEPWPQGVQAAIDSISSDYEQNRARAAYGTF